MRTSQSPHWPLRQSDISSAPASSSASSIEWPCNAQRDGYAGAGPPPSSFTDAPGTLGMDSVAGVGGVSKEA